jgi:nucleotide-binding universal stress UspA family protein
MKSHHETDVERLMKVALARELAEEHGSASGTDSLGPGTLPETGLTQQRPVQIALNKILVPTDFSPLARKAAIHAYSLAEQFGAELTLLHVTEPVSFAPPYFPLEAIKELQATRQEAAADALAGFITEMSALPGAKTVTCRSMVVEGNAASEADRVARECGADLIIIATHGYTGINRPWLGGTTERAVRHAPCPVLVVREKEGHPVPQTGPKNILVPLDLSERSLKSLRYAVAFARQYGAKLTLLHVLEPSAYTPEPLDPVSFSAENLKTFDKLLEGIRAAKIPAELPVTTIVRGNFVFDGILEVAREIEADLIVTTTHGYTGLKHVLFGGTVEKIVRKAPCSVLVVREIEHDFV